MNQYDLMCGWEGKKDREDLSMVRGWPGKVKIQLWHPEKAKAWLAARDFHD